MKDWRGKIFWLHLQVNIPGDGQGPGKITASLIWLNRIFGCSPLNRQTFLDSRRGFENELIFLWSTGYCVSMQNFLNR